MSVESLKGYLLMIDQKTWWIIIGVLAVFLVLAIIKKAIKLAMFIGMVCLIAFGGKYVNTNILEANNIKIESNTIYVMDKAVPLDQLAGMEIRNMGESQSEIILKLKDNSTASIKIPASRASVFKAIGSALNINVVEKKVQ